MAEPEKQLQVFQKLDFDTISKLFDLLNEDTVVNGLDPESIEKITKELSTEEIQHIATSLFNFVISYEHPKDMFQIINKSTLEQNKKDLLITESKNVHNRLDKKIIKQNESSSFIRDFGHFHIHKIAIVSEFRPITDEHKIKKMIPSLVVSGTLHDPNSSFDEKPINFQFNISQAEKFSKSLTDSIKNIKEEIKLINEKFGDNVIDQ